MFRISKALLAAALVFAVAPAVLGEAEIPTGAKALFGQGNEEIFYPRDAGGGGSAEMNPESQVTEEQLTSFYKRPEFPGIAYSLEVIRRGESHITTVDDPRSWEFHTGDRVRMRLVPNFSGHTYVLEAKGGQADLIYPVNFGTAENLVTAGRESYVPAQGWLRLVDPAAPFTMRVLFKPGQVDYRLNQPAPNPAVARVSLTEAVHREWQAVQGQKGMVFEADRSYVGAVPGGGSDLDSAPAAGTGSGYAAPSAPSQVATANLPYVDEQHEQLTIDRASYTTNYVVVNRQAQQEPYDDQEGDAIAIEVPIRHVRR